MNRVAPGRFLTLEGIDGAGKSSHIEWIADFLRARKQQVVTSREPGGTPLGERLRACLLSEAMSLEAEILLLFAARSEHLSAVIRPALQRGAWVVCDRFSDATYAYQGGGRQFDPERIRRLEEWAQGDLQADRTLLFDVPCAVARQRIEAAGRSQDRFEAEKTVFFERVRETYLARARREPERFRIIDGTRPVEEIRARLETILQEELSQ
ncbi:MAG: dTMP kinase [Zoogloeaceae bacterium]|jgi:dTMP kinase|nr:dTMP kinase [Zoogloeaceae bacterium]